MWKFLQALLSAELVKVVVAAGEVVAQSLSQNSNLASGGLAREADLGREANLRLEELDIPKSPSESQSASDPLHPLPAPLSFADNRNGRSNSASNINANEFTRGLDNSNLRLLSNSNDLRLLSNSVNATTSSLNTTTTTEAPPKPGQLPGGHDPEQCLEWGIIKLERLKEVTQ
jgi:hypothetical protein